MRGKGSGSNSKSSASRELSPRKHIENIRKKWFGIGAKEANKLAPMLDKAVQYLSAELYTKDVHFLMELIQNAEDNDYLEGVDPSLEFVITSRDITETGAPATLVMFNNEKGFSAKNIESICSVGNSTKVGHRKRGYIGEKGIGFKSVFLITAQPHLFSNGYQIRFNEKPCTECQLGYIVPEWIEDKPTLSDIQKLYGSACSLPTTVLVLPLKPDKVKPVKQQLSSLHPEVLLFLSKIKRLSVREDDEDPKHDSVSAIAVTKETNFAAKKKIDAESYTLHLCAEEKKGEMRERACSYYMWKQRFRVKQENRVERRMEVDEWVITLAFPNSERLHRGGGSSAGVYAYLPTEMVTNFPFVIQADFVLASSRETILLDNKWNQGILDCVPCAFVNALVSLVKTVEDAPISCLTSMFNFLPVNLSPYELFNVVRTRIQENLSQENIIPIESNTEQKFFHKPGEVRRIMSEFRSILRKAQKQGVSLQNLSSHGWYVLNSSFDQFKYNDVLKFLGVQYVENEWYAKCIESSNMLTRVPEEVYLDLLLYVAQKWNHFCNTWMGTIPLMKYVHGQTSVSFCSITECSNSRRICRSSCSEQVSWLNEWSSAFRSPGDLFFLPKILQEAILSLQGKDFFLEWLRNKVKVMEFTVNSYAGSVVDSLKTDRELVVAYAHFLYQSLCSGFLSKDEVRILCKKMPLIDRNGCVTTAKGGVLVPANGSNWSQLLASNPWTSDFYIELGEDYSCPVVFANRSTNGKDLIQFMKTYLGAVDIPEIYPPNAAISSMSAPLTKQNVFLLLRWIRHLRQKCIGIPSNFLTSIKEGGWLISTLNGSPNYRPPSQSFFLSDSGNSNWGNMLQKSSELVHIPLVDQSFYGSDIISYKEELKAVGVKFEFGDACTYIGNHLMSLAASSRLSRTQVFSILKFIRFLRQNSLSPNDFIASVEKHRWLVTCTGVRSPAGSVLYDEEWEIAREISDIPFIDGDHYGEDMPSFKEELKLLGVVVGFDKNYHTVASHLKKSFCPSSLTPKAFLLTLSCIRHSGLSDKLVAALQSENCLKTSIGYKSPSECFLSDPEWGGLLHIFSAFPLVDDEFYPGIHAFKMELKKLGVKVEFEEAVKAFSIRLKQQASSSSIDKENVFSILSCYRKLKETANNKELASCLKKSITDVCWLRTRLVDYRSPSNCILFGPEWQSISSIAVLPFVDDSDNCYGKGIHDYRRELESIGVITDLRDGEKLVLAGLHIPSDPSCILPTSVLSLLQCIRIMLEKHDVSFNDAFVKNATRDWLKTNAGYRCAEKCSLFDPKWKHVKPTDGPFIDEDFYGATLVSYKQELKAIGVAVDDVSQTCMLLADFLDSLSDVAAIVRIYNFLEYFRWKPSKENRRIRIPGGDNSWIWVNANECVLHDENGFFGLQLHVLDKHYEDKLLLFFKSEFEVKSDPSFEDHFLLWKQWENEECGISQAQCCAFWQCVLQHWGPHTRITLSANLVKLPVASKSGEILLVERSDVFLGDDILLNDLFERASPDPLFIWYPQPTLPSLPRTKLLEIYKDIGVRGISESVNRQGLSILTDSTIGHKELKPGESLFKRGLMKVILGFLAGPSVNMDVQKRHEAVKGLLNLTVLETIEPITIDHVLLRSSRESVNARAFQMVQWHKESSKFFTQKLSKSGASGRKNRMEYANNFAQAVAGGLLCEKEDGISELAELIKFVFLLEFDEKAAEYLMKSKNLQIFQEDEEFLSVAYPSADKGSRKRHRSTKQEQQNPLNQHTPRRATKTKKTSKARATKSVESVHSDEVERWRGRGSKQMPKAKARNCL